MHQMVLLSVDLAIHLSPQLSQENPCITGQPSLEKNLSMSWKNQYHKPPQLTSGTHPLKRAIELHKLGYTPRNVGDFKLAWKDNQEYHWISDQVYKLMLNLKENS